MFAQHSVPKTDYFNGGSHINFKISELKYRFNV